VAFDIAGAHSGRLPLGDIKDGLKFSIRIMHEGTSVSRLVDAAGRGYQEANMAEPECVNHNITAPTIQINRPEESLPHPRKEEPPDPDSPAHGVEKTRRRWYIGATLKTKSWLL
jgi:hypothetical protein